jgi:hypothetical protein
MGPVSFSKSYGSVVLKESLIVLSTQLLKKLTTFKNFF